MSSYGNGRWFLLHIHSSALRGWRWLAALFVVAQRTVWRACWCSCAAPDACVQCLPLLSCALSCTCCTVSFAPTCRYASRKAYAEVRPRIKGRFAKKEEVEAWRQAEAAMKGAGAADAFKASDRLVPVL